MKKPFGLPSHEARCFLHITTFLCLSHRLSLCLLSLSSGLQGVRKAGVEELMGIPGISRQLAERIFKALR